MTAELHPIIDAGLPERFSLGEYRIDLATHGVSHLNREIRLTPKATGVLRVLATHSGRAVRRDTLLEEVWLEAFPTDDVLSHAITELRRALGDDPRDSRVIETIPKVGYRLLIKPELKPDNPPTTSPVVRSLPPIHVIWGLAGVLLGALATWLVLGGRNQVLQHEVLPAPLSQAMPLTVAPGQERMPAVSADGRHIVYAAQRGAGHSYDLFVRSTGADQAIRFTATQDANELVPVWSPNGDEIAFFRYSRQSCELIIKPLVGGFERRISDCEPSAVTYLDWSPDGRYLALTGAIDHSMTTGGISLLDVNSGETRALPYDRSRSEHDLQPRYSPDGKFIMFRRGAYPRSDLFVLASDGSGLTQLTDLGGQILGFDWLPDGTRAWFCSDYGGRNALWQLNVTTQRVQLMEIGCPYMLSIARNANVMAYQHVSVDPSLIEVNLTAEVDPVQARFLSTRIEAEPSYDPTGQRVVFVSDRSGDNQLWIGDLASDEVFQLTRHQGMNLSDPSWTPDSQVVYYVGRGGSGEGMYQVDVSSGIVKRLTDNSEKVRAVSVSRDGSGVLYASDRSGDWQIWRMEVASNQRTQITVNGGTLPVDPLNDGWVYYTKLSRFGLWRIPVGGGDEELVTHLLEFYNHDSWVLNERGIYLTLIIGDAPSAIYRIPWSAEAAPELIAPVNGGTDMISLKDVSADGSKMLMVRWQNTQQDIMVSRDW